MAATDGLALFFVAYLPCSFVIALHQLFAGPVLVAMSSCPLQVHTIRIGYVKKDTTEACVVNIPCFAWRTSSPLPIRLLRFCADWYSLALTIFIGELGAVRGVGGGSV